MSFDLRLGLMTLHFALHQFCDLSQRSVVLYYACFCSFHQHLKLPLLHMLILLLMEARLSALLRPAIGNFSKRRRIEKMLILIAVVAGMFGGILMGMYFGKVYPMHPREWRHYVYLALGIILI